MDSEARIEPPIHTEYLRSGGAMILIFIVDGANAVEPSVVKLLQSKVAADPDLWSTPRDREDSTDTNALAGAEDLHTIAKALLK